MHIQTCWQCGAKNQIDEETGQGRPPLCAQCGAELATVATAQSERAWPEQNDSGLRAGRSTLALTQRFSTLSISHALIAINVIVFVLMVLSGVHPFEPTTESIYRWGADFGPASMGPETWRLVSSMFIHIGIIHLALNMYVLWSIGPLVEELFGKIGFLTLYLLTGIGGSLLSILYKPEIVSAGASGAVFGLFGGLLALLLTQKSAFPPHFVQQHLQRVILFLAFNIFYGLSQSYINNAAHLGGLATGFMLALVMRPDLTGRRPRWKARQFAGVLVVVLALCAGGFAAKRRADGSSEARYWSIEYSPDKVTIQPGQEIFFSNGATRDDAQKLARTLQESEAFKSIGDLLIILSKDSKGFEVSYSIRPEAFDDPKALKQMEVQATNLSDITFDKTPVAINLCDEYLTPVKTVRSGSILTITPRQKIYFRDGVTEAEAQGLRQALQERTYFEGSEGAYIELSKNQNGYEILFIVKDGTWDDPKLVAWFEELAADLSANALHNQPVKIDLSDGEFDIKKTIKTP